MDPDVRHSRERLLEVAALVPGWKGKDIEFEMLQGGRTNQNFVARVNGARYVVRIANQRARENGICRDAEYAVWQAAYDAGIAPRILWHDRDRGDFVSEFIEGWHWPPNEIHRGDNLSRLTTALRIVHGLKVAAGPFDPVSLGCAFEQRSNHCCLTLEFEERWRSQVCAILSHMANDQKSRLCHNDMGRSNFIDDGTRLWLIDWECAGLGNPFYDLAAIAHNNRLSVCQEADLIRAYAGNLLPEDLERLARLKVAHDFYHVFWYALQLSHAELTNELRENCSFHLNRLDKELRAFRADGTYNPAAR